MNRCASTGQQATRKEKPDSERQLYAERRQPPAGVQLARRTRSAGKRRRQPSMLTRPTCWSAVRPGGIVACPGRFAPPGGLAAGGTCPAGGPPTVPLNLVGDFAGALYLVAGLLAALHESRSSGVGQVVDAAMVDSTAHLMTVFHGLLASGAWQDRPGANLLDGSAPFYGVYRTADDRWLAVGPLEQPFYDEFVTLLGLSREVADRSDPAVWPDLHDMVATVIGSRSQADWVAVFAGSDACVAPGASLAQAQQDPHLVARAQERSEQHDVHFGLGGHGFQVRQVAGKLRRRDTRANDERLES